MLARPCISPVSGLHLCWICWPGLVFLRCLGDASAGYAGQALHSSSGARRARACICCYPGFAKASRICGRAGAAWAGAGRRRQVQAGAGRWTGRHVQTGASSAGRQGQAGGQAGLRRQVRARASRPAQPGAGRQAQPGRRAQAGIRRQAGRRMQGSAGRRAGDRPGRSDSPRLARGACLAAGTIVVRVGSGKLREPPSRSRLHESFTNLRQGGGRPGLRSQLRRLSARARARRFVAKRDVFCSAGSPNGAFREVFCGPPL